MYVKKIIQEKRRIQEQRLKKKLKGQLTDNDRLWAALVALIEYLEEKDDEQR